MKMIALSTLLLALCACDEQIEATVLEQDEAITSNRDVTLTLPCPSSTDLEAEGEKGAWLNYMTVWTGYDSCGEPTEENVEEVSQRALRRAIRDCENDTNSYSCAGECTLSNTAITCETDDKVEIFTKEEPSSCWDGWDWEACTFCYVGAVAKASGEGNVSCVLEEEPEEK